MDGILSNQTLYLQNLRRFVSNYKKDSKVRKSVSYLNKKLQMLEALHKDAVSLHKEAMTLLKKDPSELEHPYYKSNLFADFEDEYAEIAIEIAELLEQLKSVSIEKQAESSPSESVSVNSEVKLPRISLPIFSGDYAAWISYRDLFVSLIHNRKNLSSVEKLHYLKGSLVGEAAKLLSQFGITEANYLPAWNILNARYDNKNVLLRSQFKRLFNMKAAYESASSIKILLDSTVECLQTIENLDVEKLWDAFLVYLTTERLPIATRQLWEQQQASTENVSSFNELKMFLEKRFRVLEASGSERVKPQTSVIRANINSVQSSSDAHCVICKEAHPVQKCKRFIDANQHIRFDLAKKNGLCLNCLRKGHLLSNCPSSSRCIHCKKTHHSLLHRSTIQSSSMTPYPSSSFEDSQHVNMVNSGVERSFSGTNNRQILLATAMVTLGSPKGQLVVRALLDQGSQVSIVSESVAQQLGLQKRKISAKLVGIGETNIRTSNSCIEMNLILKDKSSLKVNALVMSSLSNFIPLRSLSISSCEELKDLQLADPHFDRSRKVDILLGADIYAKIILGNVRVLSIGPIAQETRLGWIISGEVTPPTEYRSFNITMDNSDVNLSEQLQLFWKLEEVNPVQYLTPEEQQCEEHFVANVSRKEDGRYMVRLPFRTQGIHDTLGKSRRIAHASLSNLEKKFSLDTDLKEEYSKCLQEYLDSDYMEECTEELAQPHYFLPHHAVRKDSTTSKLRVVFDAARKTTSGISLNDILLTGPSLSSNMIAVILRWRLNMFAFVADIARMFLQIGVHPDDRRYQMILWRKDSKEEVKDYYLKTVTFGTTCAPFLAIRTLHQLAEDEKHRFPNAHRIILENSYVDDILSGGNSLAETIEFRKEIDLALASGGFKLRKWVANDPQILEKVPLEDIEQINALSLDFEGVKSLGIIWLPISDRFTYRVKLSDVSSHTKRSMLADIARLYDPMGWLSPVVLKGKLFIKSLWLHGMDWDESIPAGIETEWTTYRRGLLDLEQIQIPRYVGFESNSRIELHGFCDASKFAYAGVVYMVARKNDKTSVHLLTSKTKASPVKEQTIPRLELCGALLLAKLMKSVIDILKVHENVYLWCDSSIVLAYLSKPPQKLPIFEANRATQIRENVGNIPWKHVRSWDNPADIASRGTSAQDLKNTNLWWYGPPWLKKSSCEWDLSIPEEVVFENEQFTNQHVKISDTIEQLLEKYSNLSTLLRVTAYCLRFASAIKGQVHEKGLLTTSELNDARKFWIKYVQHNEFAEEIARLKNSEKVNVKSKIHKLFPFIDGDGILRVSGRLANAELTNDEKSPIIIPKGSRFTDLLIRQTHEVTLHGNVQLMLTILRRKYWVIDGRKLIKYFVHRCVKCFRMKTHESSQLMGSLPKPRVTITRPFTHTGVDYCGPLQLKDRNGRGSRIFKGYVVIFICFAVKAIHVELVTDLTTQTFLAALTRFVGRRGLCQYLYSDCGTNFIGANVELNKIVKHNIVQNKLVDMGITWKFNPPASPHFGGLWEAGVRSIKYHLRRIVGTTVLTYEEMLTALVQIERCLNSRPLCPLTDDPSDTSTLTPAHFLIGDSLMAVPEVDVTEESINRLTRWQLTQRIAQNFWRRWKNEYLNILQQRPKWLSQTECPKVGDLCLLKDERNPPYKWPLARIVELHPGSDSLIRVVTVKANNSIYKRAITKIVPLPMN